MDRTKSLERRTRQKRNLYSTYIRGFFLSVGLLWLKQPSHLWDEVCSCHVLVGDALALAWYCTTNDMRSRVSQTTFGRWFEWSDQAALWWLFTACSAVHLWSNHPRRMRKQGLTDSLQILKTVVYWPFFISSRSNVNLITFKFGAHALVPLRLNCNNFDDPLIFSKTFGCLLNTCKTNDVATAAAVLCV